MPIDKALVRRAKKSGGSAFVIEQGPSGIFYHDPQTGQEFPRLPKDPWSLETYMRKGWLPGRAPEHLRLQWEETKKTLNDPAEAHLVEAEMMLAERQKNIVSQLDQNLLKLVEDLTAKVMSLESTFKSQGVTPEQTTMMLVEEQESSVVEEPRQLELKLAYAT